MKHCRACGHHTTEVMDFGRVALAGAFLSPHQFESEAKHPLTLEFCEKCWLLQTGQDVAGMFDHYFYFSSATSTMREHFRQYASYLKERFNPSRVLEIGCNDGVLLRPLRDLGLEVVGVDPAANVTEGLGVVSAHWGARTAESLGRFDLIVANNVWAHIPDINDACAGVARALTERGVFAIEVNRLDSMLCQIQYDWVYHEHCFYYSLIALENLLARHGMRVYDCQRLGTHAGSVRYYICKDDRPETHKVMLQRTTERWMGLDKPERYLEFAAKAKAHAREFRALVDSFERVAGYGACGRTNTMLQLSGVSNLLYIIDDAPAKNGLYTPGTHIPIICREEADRHEAPDCLIVFAWSFLQEIAPKIAGYPGRVFVPLPHIYEHKLRAAA